MVLDKLNEGFSIIESLIAIVVALSTTSAILFGVSHLQRATDLINMEEKAFEQLSNYTEAWRAKIGAGEWVGTNSWANATEFDLVKKDKKSVRATLGKRGYVVNGNFPYPLYSLETRIQWSPNPTFPEQQEELRFKVYQIEFK